MFEGSVMSFCGGAILEYEYNGTFLSTFLRFGKWTRHRTKNFGSMWTCSEEDTAVSSRL